MMSSFGEWPERIIMVGGGVTGAEYSSYFNCLGIPVSWITDMNTFLPRSDDDVSDMLVRQMTARGVELLTKSPVEAIESGEEEVRVVLRSGRIISGSHAFIAIGRRPDITRLNLEAAGITTSRMGVSVDGFGRTSKVNIYAVGDVCGPPFTVNRGQAQAVIAVRHLLGRPVQPVRDEILVEAIYSEPQVAQVGLTETAAWAAGQAVRTMRKTYSQVLKPVIAGEKEGFFKLLIEPNSRRILGGAAVGTQAVDLINMISLAVMQGLSLDLLTGWFPAYPSLAELISEMISGEG
jgi:dihydrolipoamide dehydrogenase